MFNRAITGAKHVLGLHQQGRNLVVFPDDVFIVSYPKSGNTWTRFLVANLAYPHEQVNFANINRLIPDPEALSKREMTRLPRPRYIKSHQYFDPRYQKIVYVVRDPRDVALSQYHFHRKRRLVEDGAPVEQFITRFVAGGTSPYASWGENVGGWLATRLGWDPGSMVARGDVLEGRARGRRAEVTLCLEPVRQDVPGLAGVTIETADGMSISLDRNPGGLIARRRDPRGHESTWKLLGASRGESGILGEGVRQALLRDPTYLPALDCARAFVA